MDIIASTGAKGGVGKSTFAVLLSFKFLKDGKKVVLCDCDVECPNDHLILGKDLDDDKSEVIYQDYPVLDEDKCKKCGLCSETCRENAIFHVDGRYPMFMYDLCTGCGACWAVCPYNAIGTKKKKSGDYFVNKIKDDFYLVTGRSKSGIAETGPIASEVKKKAIEFAKEKNADVIIMDTSPGTHCNVIQALLGCDSAYAVTEPTPLGAHDLNLILELLEKIDVPSNIVLNKSDVGDRGLIEDIAEDFGVDIKFNIPYSEKIIEAYCRNDLESVIDLVD